MCPDALPGSPGLDDGRQSALLDRRRTDTGEGALLDRRRADVGQAALPTDKRTQALGGSEDDSAWARGATNADVSAWRRPRASTP